MITFLFKLAYYCRKKISGWVINYLKLEYKYLFPGRIDWGKLTYITKFPNIYFDNTKSKLILHDGVSIRGESHFLFYNGGIIQVGKNTFFNNNCSVNSFEKIEIGENCLFGENVKMYDHNHLYKDKSVNIREQGYSTAPIIIGKNCWFGSNVTILKGVTIGDNVVVGANCLVLKSIPSNSVIKVKQELS